MPRAERGRLGLSESQSSLSFPPGSLVGWRRGQAGPGVRLEAAETTGGSSPDQGVGLCPQAATSIPPGPLSVPGQLVKLATGRRQPLIKAAAVPARPAAAQRSPQGPEKLDLLCVPQPAPSPSPSTQPSLGRQKCCPAGRGLHTCSPLLLQDENNPCHSCRGSDPHLPSGDHTASPSP